MLKTLKQIFPLDALIRALPMLLTAFGVVLLAISFVFFPEPLYPVRHGLFRTIGQAVLISGVVGVLIDTFKYMGIFKEALHEVMFGEDHLKARTDLSDIWLRVTLAITKNKFPTLSEHLKKGVLDKYVPAEKDFYYSRYYRECVLSWHDKDKGIVEVDEYIELSLVPAAGLAECNYTYRNRSNSLVAGVPGYFTLEDLKIDGKDYASHIEDRPYTDEFGKEGREHAYQIKLTGDGIKYVQRRTRKRTCITVEPFLEYSSQNFILDTTVKFRSDAGDLAPVFVSIGTDDFDDQKLTDGQWAVHRTFSKMMFPNQGYLMVIRQVF